MVVVFVRTNTIMVYCTYLKDVVCSVGSMDGSDVWNKCQQEDEVEKKKEPTLSSDYGTVTTITTTTHEEKWMNGMELNWIGLNSFFVFVQYGGWVVCGVWFVG